MAATAESKISISTELKFYHELMLLGTIAATLGFLNKERFTFEHLEDFSRRIKLFSI